MKYRSRQNRQTVAPLFYDVYSGW